MEFYKFPSIEQFRSVIKAVTQATRYTGRDEDDKPIFDHSKSLPTLKFTGTVKLHGTNHSIVMTRSSEDNFYTQSRERITTLEKDNAGSSVWSYQNKEHFLNIFKDFDREIETCILYGEWCGGNIQAKVAINGLPKMFVIFGIKLIDKNDNSKWLSDSDLANTISLFTNAERKIFSIYQFPTFEIEIDFNNPGFVQNKLIELTDSVEKECPVGKYFGVSGIGEGIVWKHEDFIFKIKGEEHAGKSKVKTLNIIDIERLENINKVVEFVTPEWRLEQMYQNVFDTLNGGEGDVKRLGDFIKAVNSDIYKEESETLITNGFGMADIAKELSNTVRTWFFKKLNSN